MPAPAPKSTSGHLPLLALISMAFVAFTIEFDNEFEYRVPHRTTNHGHTPGYPRAPWLVSMAMWVKYMQYIPLDGIAVGDLQSCIGVSSKGLQVWLTRLGKWWGYLMFDPPMAAGSSKRIPAQAVVRPSPGGRIAMEAWRPLTAQIEGRWRERFGNETIDHLEEALRAIVDRLDPSIPDSFPIMEYDTPKQKKAAGMKPANEHNLPALLTRVLLAFASEFDGEARGMLAVSANLLRLTADDGVRLRDLPELACLSKEGVEAALRMSKRLRLAVVEPEGPLSRTKVVRLTAKGRIARDAYVPRTQRIEEAWKLRFGKDSIAALRTALEKLAIGEAGHQPPLLRGLVPNPGGWRASFPPLKGLPHFPMVSHRGGFPDGS
ncbi:MAG TPA: hypothetical protein VMU48_09110 [Terracidiphilus sp.]|nr:hypothetical protein [Terracidiphilus sp.]